MMVKVVKCSPDLYRDKCLLTNSQLYKAVRSVLCLQIPALAQNGQNQHFWTHTHNTHTLKIPSISYSNAAALGL